ncbi:MAG: ribonuclease R [Methylococcales bacterium]|nr:ribonuclease R [Methylococcales bacterium]
MLSKKNKGLKADPQSIQESKKYDSPIFSREYIIDFFTQQDAPQSVNQLCKAFQYEKDDNKIALKRRLKAMVRDGQLIRNRNKTYCLMSSKDLIKGRVISHPDGFGFLVPEKGGEDYFLFNKQMRKVFHNDVVEARFIGYDRKNKQEATIVNVVERNTTQIVGRFLWEDGKAYVEADHKRITHRLIVPKNQINNAQEGQIVVAQVTSQPDFHQQPVGEIIEVLGDHMAPGLEIEVAMRSNDIPHLWPEEVEQELNKIGDCIAKSELEHRKDYRHLDFVTIDGEDARDFDDAVYCHKTAKGWRLYVAIADVSSYVSLKSALNTEAQSRGTSVYFPDNVIPMLPEKLSNGLCSLKPDVDRLVVVCEILFDDAGEVVRTSFHNGVICSSARLIYDQVYQIIKKDFVINDEKLAFLSAHLKNLYQLYQLLWKKREFNGAINFDSQETRIVFSEDRKIQKIVPVVRNEAHLLIEVFMIAANIAASNYLIKKRIPALYRIHMGPSVKKLEDLRVFLAEFGLDLSGGANPEPRDYAKLLVKIKNRDDRHLIETVLLRSLSQAVYNPENQGHFGLALESYCHFTSPIRRFPDLIVHRGIKHAIAKQKADSYAYNNDELNHIAELCSQAERRADDATRDAVSWLKCEYMMDRIGEQYQGIVTGVASFGLFIQLNDIFVEGFVHITALPKDYYNFDPIHQRLIGQSSSTTFRLSDVVTIEVLAVNIDEKKIDFALIEYNQRKKSRKNKSNSSPWPKKKAKPSDKKKRKSKKPNQLK